MLIDCWAGWCSPCMAKMPQLKPIHECRHGNGFEVIGVNFDHYSRPSRRAGQDRWPALGRGLRAGRRTHTRALGRRAWDHHASSLLFLIDRAESSAGRAGRQNLRSGLTHCLRASRRTDIISLPIGAALLPALVQGCAMGNPAAREADSWPMTSGLFFGSAEPANVRFRESVALVCGLLVWEACAGVETNCFSLQELFDVGYEGQDQGRY